MGTQRGAREGTNLDELLVDEGFNAILGGIIQKKFGLEEVLVLRPTGGSILFSSELSNCRGWGRAARGMV